MLDFYPAQNSLPNTLKAIVESGTYKVLDISYLLSIEVIEKHIKSTALFHFCSTKFKLFRIGEYLLKTNETVMHEKWLCISVSNLIELNKQTILKKLIYTKNKQQFSYAGGGDMWRVLIFRK